ncbi:MAG: LysR family transcriptional regulator [Acidobacteriaceae bacterium]|nr:LysR family transcriptional regulator [Acidobacteriaceae bacterium]
MDLRQLEMLVAVVDNGSYKKAGEALHVSHSAIHRQIRILEQELGDRLLVRKGKSACITESGAALVTVARRVQQDIANFQQQIRKVNRLETGHLRIGTGTSVLTFFLPPVLQRFRSEYPGVEVRITTGTGDQVVRDIQNGKLDVGVVYAPRDMPPGEAVPQYELLYPEEFVLAVGHRHPLGARRFFSLQEAVKFPFILYPKPSHVRRLFDRVLETEGLRPQVIMEVENEEAMEKLIAVNIGIALLSKSRAVSDRVRQVRLRDLRFYCDVGLVYPTSEYVPAAVSEFARMCRAAVPCSKQRQSKYITALRY